MLVRIAAVVLLVLLLWTIFRFAMGLRWAKLTREGSRAAEQKRGRKVLAEIPVSNDEVVFFLEDDAGFYWGERQVRKRDLRGARLLLNGAVVAGVTRGDEPPLPEPSGAAEHLGREAWEVVLFMSGGGTERISCGALREGVSREAARRVFEAVRSVVRPEGERP